MVREERPRKRNPATTTKNTITSLLFMATPSIRRSKLSPFQIFFLLADYYTPAGRPSSARQSCLPLPGLDNPRRQGANN